MVLRVKQRNMDLGPLTVQMKAGTIREPLAPPKRQCIPGDSTHTRHTAFTRSVSGPLTDTGIALLYTEIHLFNHFRGETEHSRSPDEGNSVWGKGADIYIYI